MGRLTGRHAMVTGGERHHDGGEGLILEGLTADEAQQARVARPRAHDDPVERERAPPGHREHSEVRDVAVRLPGSRRSARQPRASDRASGRPGVASRERRDAAAQEVERLVQRSEQLGRRRRGAAASGSGRSAISAAVAAAATRRGRRSRGVRRDRRRRPRRAASSKRPISARSCAASGRLAPMTRRRRARARPGVSPHSSSATIQARSASIAASPAPALAQPRGEALEGRVEVAEQHALLRREVAEERARRDVGRLGDARRPSSSSKPRSSNRRSAASSIARASAPSCALEVPSSCSLASFAHRANLQCLQISLEMCHCCRSTRSRSERLTFRDERNHMRRIAQWCHDRHRLVIGLWIALIVGLGGLAAGVGGGFVDNFSLPGSESQRAYDLLADKFPQQAGRLQPGRLQGQRRHADDAAAQGPRSTALVAELGDAARRRRRRRPVRRRRLDQRGRHDRLRHPAVRRAGLRPRQGRRRARHRHREGRRHRRPAGQPRRPGDQVRRSSPSSRPPRRSASASRSSC